MSRSPTTPSTRLAQALGLALSASALVGLVYVETVAASPEPASAAELDDVEDLGLEAEALPESTEVIPTEAPLVPAEPVRLAAAAPAPVPSLTTTALAVATETKTETAVEVNAEAEAIEPPAPAMVVMPDLQGMRLDKARRQLKQLGLRLVARDSYGDRIERSWYRDYKVRRQRVEAGTELEPGTRVKVKARERFRATQGY